MKDEPPAYEKPGPPRWLPQSGAREIPSLKAQVPYPGRQTFSPASNVTKEGVPAPEETELPRDPKFFMRIHKITYSLTAYSLST
jgi:hypothetical protein